MRPRFAALPCSVLTSAAMVLTLLPGAAAAAEDDLRIDSVGVATLQVGGYPTIGWGFEGLRADFSDQTSAGGHDYVVSAVPEAGGDPVTGAFEPYQGWDGVAANVRIGTAEDFQIGATYLVSVAEYDSKALVGRSAEVPFTVSVMDHPARATVRKREVAGRKNTVRAGSVVRIRWRGDWEKGTRLSQVVYAPPRRGDHDGDDFLFCEGSWCPTKRGVRWVAGGTEPVSRFRVPRRFAGRTLRVVSSGTLVRDGVVAELQWGWEWTFKVRRN